MKYILFVREDCPYCVKAESLLKQIGAEYKIVNFTKQQSSLLQEVKDAYDWQTVPMIFERDGNIVNFIGGFTDLIKYLNEKSGLSWP
tara:strand:+ start:535 stop:795 length:261 start_codon:yes stop_codon:yes gene_type:complete